MSASERELPLDTARIPQAAREVRVTEDVQNRPIYVGDLCDEIERLRGMLQSEDAMRHAIIGGLSLATDENGLNRKSYGEIADVILNEIAKSRSLNENRATVQALHPSHVPALMHIVSMLDHGNTKVAREEAMRLLNEVRGRE